MPIWFMRLMTYMQAQGRDSRVSQLGARVERPARHQATIGSTHIFSDRGVKSSLSVFLEVVAESLPLGEAVTDLTTRLPCSLIGESLAMPPALVAWQKSAHTLGACW